MKLDSEPVFCHSALGHKPDSKPFEYNDNAIHTAMKSGNLIMKENQKRISCDLKGTERGTGGLPYDLDDSHGWTATNFDCSLSMDGLKIENQDEVRDFVASPIHSSRETGPFDKDSDVVMDKSIMECGLPELTVCYKESNYHVVKDICIDEGVPSQEKILFESGTDEKTLCIFLPAVKDQNKELVKEKEDIDTSIPDALKFSAENDSNKDSANQCDPKDLMTTGEDSPVTIANDVSKEMFLPGEKLPVVDMGTYTSHYKSSNNDEVEQQPFQVSGEEAILANHVLISATEESNNSSEDSILANSTLVSASEESNNSRGDSMLASTTLVSAVEELNNSSGDQMLAAEESNNDNGDAVSSSPTKVSAAEETNGSSLSNELYYNSKVESGSITFDFDSLAPAVSGRKLSPENGDNGLETKKMSELENGISDTQTVSRQLQHGQGEVSFSAAGQGEESFSAVGTLSSLINFSGPVTNSGSISLRSDSSTTSTRSFAFPVLQSEWNSSPVRMAKADQRCFRKHRGWKQGLLCCRF
ncbi:uncharacterized protein LOC142629501 isoform X1 [Castanea sativa]|uniref:uncharacterized protein LOC142629501 isoform X1 n=1 Tax=Castanea sativa TaxID=21020 RepID=UPI003F64A658